MPSTINQSIRARTRPAADLDELQQSILEMLFDTIEYTLPNESLTKLREVTPLYIKAVSEKGKEYYFPIAARRRGVYYQILSILVKETPLSIPKWDVAGKPISGVRLVDDMVDASGGVWYRAFEVNQLKPLFTTPKAYLVTQ